MHTYYEDSGKKIRNTKNTLSSLKNGVEYVSITL
jgi:hypothetical protein